MHRHITKPLYLRTKVGLWPVRYANATDIHSADAECEGVCERPWPDWVDAYFESPCGCEGQDELRQHPLTGVTENYCVRCDRVWYGREGGE